MKVRNLGWVLVFGWVVCGMPGCAGDGGGGRPDGAGAQGDADAGTAPVDGLAAPDDGLAPPDDGLAPPDDGGLPPPPIGLPCSQWQGPVGDDCGPEAVCVERDGTCQPSGGWPGVQCALEGRFSPSFGGDTPVPEAGVYTGTVVEVGSGRLRLETDAGTLVFPYEVGPHALPVAPGQAVIATHRKQTDYGPADGLRLQHPDGTLLFVGDAGAFGSAWTPLGTETAELMGLALSTELVGCPAVPLPVEPDCAQLVPLGLRVTAPGGETALAWPGQTALLALQMPLPHELGTGYRIVNADVATLADLECADLWEPYSYLIIQDPPLATAAAGGRGAPCATDADCTSGVCLPWPGGAGQVCSVACTASCEPGFACRGRWQGADLRTACHPASGAAGAAGSRPFEEPCQANAECASGWCLPGPADTTVCSRNCVPAEPPDDDGCPDGYRCAALANTYPDVVFACAFVPPPPPGEFGDPCTENADCRSGLCIESPAGRVCTETCISECPAGFECRAFGAGPDVLFVCLPVE